MNTVGLEYEGGRLSKVRYHSDTTDEVKVRWLGSRVYSVTVASEDYTRPAVTLFLKPEQLDILVTQATQQQQERDESDEDSS